MIQSLKKIWLVVSNMTWWIWWIFTQPFKSLKIYFWWVFFIQNIQGLKNDERNLVNFHANSWKSRNLHFDRHLLSKVYTVLVEKVNVSWHWRVMQSLKKSSLLVPKMTRGIWWSLMRAVASLKIYTFLC